MAPSNNNACYYGAHFGCLNVTRDAECTLCAERLTHAVQHVLHPGREVSEAHDVMCGEGPSYTVNGHQDWRTVQPLAINQTNK